MKTETYREQKTRHTHELNNFEGLFWAFNEKQFQEGVVKVGASKENKVVSIGAGGYLLKNRGAALDEMLARHKQEKKELKKSNKLLLEALVYELNNHEFVITCDVKPALDALGFKETDIDLNILRKAKNIVYEQNNEVTS